jgi:DNA-directed RNA polymerase specialized sigma24 family protein
MRMSKIAARKAKLLLMQIDAPTFAPEVPAEQIDPRPEMVCFRGQTLALVRHHFELSSQLGRLPSLMGREFFRARVSHHRVPSFEEQAVFVRDVELCIARLNAEYQEIVMIAGLYDFSHEEIAEMLHISKAAVSTWFAEALDALSEIFLEAGLLSEKRPDRRQRQVTSGSFRGAGARRHAPRRVNFPIPEESGLGAAC